MTATFRRYTPDDYLRIRDFLVSAFGQTGEPGNWLIDRWNFCRHFTLVMHATIPQWENTVGIWEGPDNILAVVNSEGERSGEAFFQVGAAELPADLLAELFTYAEDHLAVEHDGRRIIRLRIPEGDPRREAMAAARGFARQPRREVMSVLDIAGWPQTALPPGFCVRSGPEVSDAAKGRAHAQAFEYLDTEYAQRSAAAYELMRQAPDYRPELDLYAVAPTGAVACFCTMWLDRTNRIGILEPLGTVPGFQRMGLARALIGEAVRRTAAAGATRVFVGSGQEFYTAIGFRKAYWSGIWEKVM